MRKQDSSLFLNAERIIINIVDLTLDLDELGSKSRLDRCNLCLKPLKDISDIFTVNQNPECSHKFHKECIKEFINRKCEQIYGFKIKCPNSRCSFTVTLESAIKILSKLDDIFRFEANLYIAN